MAFPLKWAPALACKALTLYRNFHMGSPKPVLCNLNLTSRCQGRCGFCELSKGEVQPPVELTSEEISSLIVSLKRLGVYRIVVDGGEPLFHPHFFEILDLFAANRFQVRLVTNGLRLWGLKPEQFRKLTTQVEGLVVSFNALDAKSYGKDHSGREGDFRRLLAGLERLKKADCRTFSLLCVLHEKNFREISLFVERASKLGAGNLLFQPVNTASNFPDLTALPSKEVFLPVLDGEGKRDLDRALVEGIEMARRLGMSTNLRSLARWIGPYFQYAGSETLFFQHIPGLGRYECLVPSMHINVHYTGDVLPCFLRVGEKMNLRETSLEEIWANRLPAYRFRANGHWPEACRNCFCSFPYNALMSSVLFPFANRKFWMRGVR